MEEYARTRRADSRRASERPGAGRTPRELRVRALADKGAREATSRTALGFLLDDQEVVSSGERGVGDWERAVPAWVDWVVVALGVVALAGLMVGLMFVEPPVVP